MGCSRLFGRPKIESSRDFYLPLSLILSSLMIFYFSYRTRTLTLPMFSMKYYDYSSFYLLFARRNSLNEC